MKVAVRGAASFPAPVGRHRCPVHRPPGLGSQQHLIQFGPNLAWTSGFWPCTHCRSGPQTCRQPSAPARFICGARN